MTKWQDFLTADEVRQLADIDQQMENLKAAREKLNNRARVRRHRGLPKNNKHDI